VELNHELEITDVVSVIDYDHYMSTPASAKWLSNGNLIVGDMATMEPGAMQDLYVKIMDQDLNTVHDTLIFYSMEPTYIAVNNGIDYTDENNIWLGTFYGVPPGFSGTEVFRIHIFDSNGQLKGMKVYGGDQRYWFTNLIATSDGGCIMTGAIPDYDGAENNDAYFIKVMPDDILTHSEDTPLKFDRDVAVFPNPFTDFLYFKTLRKNLRVTILDNTGKEVLCKKLSRLSKEGLVTNNLQPGFYYYTITDNGRIIQSGKLMKK
jgi:hypothetical protein